MTIRPFIGLALLVIVVMFVALALRSSDEDIVQPVAFNHNVHVEQEEMECTDCHVHVEDLPSATIPSITICEDCHSDEPISESEEEVRLLRFIEEGIEVPWQRIYTVAPHVYFSHRRHVVLGEVACTTCHGDVPQLTVPAPRALTTITMQWCLDCHEENKVTQDCLACHR